MPSAGPDPTLVARFHRGLTRCAAAAPSGAPPPFDGRIGLAVSGGGDSLALLLLANARFAGRIEAATFDHGFRPESAAEALHAARVCASLGVPHTILRPGIHLPADEIADTGRRHSGGLQALARAWRYRALGRWCRTLALPWLLTGHHAGDQAETVLMRLARGSGPRGLSGIRPAIGIDHAYREGVNGDDMRIGSATVGRPLLGFDRDELMGLVHAARIEPVVDPSNADPRFDRTRARALLADTDWIDARRLAATAEIMRDCDAALDWATDLAARTHLRDGDEEDVFVIPGDLPPAILRRLCEEAIQRVVHDMTTGLHAARFRGGEITTLIERLSGGRPATLCEVMATPGDAWRFRPAPPRRTPSGKRPRFAISVRLETNPPRLTIGGPR